MYRSTDRGVSHFRFLVQDVDDEKKRAAMTLKDWACEQIITLLDSNEGMSRKQLYDCVIYTRDSILDGSWQCLNPKAGRETARIHDYASIHLDSLLRELRDRGLICRFGQNV